VKRIPRILVSLVIAGIMVTSVGCNLLPNITVASNTPAPATQPSPLQPGFTVPSPAVGQSTALPGIADVVAKVKPSVVRIDVVATSTDIFGRTVNEQGAGSGWIIDKSGIIVTNNHVVDGASKVTVTLDDGRVFDAKVNAIATDALSDLAVVKIDAANLPAATVGDSGKLRVGDWVVAIGNSLGQGIRATLGIVSQQQASLELDSGQTLSGLIETDAAINPGNSGGPLVNIYGEVVGITSIKIAQVGVEGVGYAISSNEAVPIIQQLVNAGYVTRPFLGVSMDTVNALTTIRYNLSVDKGAVVVTVQAGSPAETAGLKPGDVVVKFGGTNITTPDELRQAIQKSQIGQSVGVVYWRGQSQNTTSATLIATPR